MVGKNNQYLKNKKDGTKVESYSIKKFKVGTASVVIGASIFFGAGAVAQASEEVSNNTTSDNTTNAGEKENVPTSPVATAQPVAKETTKEDVASAVAAKLGGETAKEVKALDKTKLENYIAEIEEKLANGTYDSKTEESVAVLKADLEAAKATLANATTQDEITKAYSKLVTTANTKLKAKPVEKKETPEVDTTNGQPTVGKKAENTEPKEGTNSIENSGTRDSRNGKALDKDNAFRAETTVTSGNISYTLEFSDDATKEIYLYNEEDANLNITVNSTAGKITTAAVKGGSGQYLKKGKGVNDPIEAEEIDGWGWTYHSILEATQGPATVRVTGKPNEEFKKLSGYTKQESQHAGLGDRYLQIYDEAGGKIEKTSGKNASGYFRLVVKSQTYKYQPKELTNTNKVLVANPKQLTSAELESVKNSLKVIYSTTSTDARLEKLKGTEVADTSSVVDTVTDSGSNLIVTYKDGSTDTIPKGTLIKSGNAPTVNLPYPASGGPREKSILSTDKTITGTGTPGSKITIQVESAENGKVLKEITDIPVDASGNWTVTLENGLNSNVPVGGNSRAQNFFAPKNPVKVFETKDGIETPSTNTYVSIGASKVLPSEASKDKASVVAGSKEVVLEVPHDAGISYFWYHDKDTGKEVQIDIQRDKEVAENLGIKVADKDVDKVAIKSVTPGEFYNTITLEMKKNIKEGVVRIISHNNDGTHSSKAGKVSTPVTNEKPVVASVSGEDTTTVITNSQLNLLSLVKVTDHEDDQPDVTLGDRAHARVISVDGNTSVREVDTSEAGEHTVVYKAVDSQGKESDEYTHKVIVRENKVPEVEIPFSNVDKKQVYVYGGEEDSFDIKFKDDSGKIKSATVVQGGNNAFKEVPGETNKIDVEWGYTANFIDAETPATEDAPAIIRYSGTPGGNLTAAQFEKARTEGLVLGKRYATATDLDNAILKNTARGNSFQTDPGAFEVVLKPQTKKYDLKELDEANKIVVTDITNIPKAELDKIKENIPLEYSKKNEDKNLEDKKGKAVEKADVAKVVDTVVQKGENLEVTYKDGSKDTIPVEKVVKLDKQPAIDAVTNKATEQTAAINGNDKLTPAEKEKAIAEVNKDKDAALEKIADATNAADITAAKEEGTAAVAKVNPVAKEAAKQAIADTLKAKNDALDKRADLTDVEKAAAKKEAKRLADDELAKINAQDDNKATAEEAKAAQAEVDAAKKKGVDEVTAVNPVAKEQAKKAVADKLAEVEKGIDDRTDLTLEEKEAAKEKAKAAAKTATDAIDKEPNFVNSEQDATAAQEKVKQAKDTGLGAIEAANPTAEKKPEANKEVATEADKKKQEIADDKKLSEAAKKKLQDEVDAVKKASEEAIQAAKKNANVDKVKAAGKNAIAAINSVRLPANKVIVPTGTEPLSQDKQTEIQKAIEAVNPKGTTVVVKPDGTAEVTLPNGKSKNLTKAELTKTDADLDNPGGGNDINRPADKVIVGNPAQLTDAEKEKIKKAVRDVNPNSVVSIDDNGTVTVSTPEGKTAGFPASELVRTLADAAKDDSGNAGVRKPADKVVGDATNPADQDKATEKLKKLNGGDDKVKAIKYDDEGNATVVLKDGTIATIPASDLFKTEEEAKKANGGDDINKPNSQTVVANKNALTGPEREAIKAKIAAVNPEGSVITVNEKGEATVTTPEGKTAVIDADDLVKGADEKTNPKAGNNINNPADRVQVADKANLKPEEIAKIKAAVEAVNPGATVVVDEKGNATVTTPAAPGVEQKTATIPVSELVKTPTDKDNVTGGNQVNTPADRVVVENPAALTSEEKKAIEAKIKAVNPGADVVFDANGNATVTTPAAPGEQPKTATIPVSDLVKAKADLADPTKQDAVNKPADKVVVDPALVAADKDLPQEAKDAIKAAVAAVNPGSTVVVDDKGNATVTTKDGKTVVIPKADLVKKETDKETAKAGNNINKPADKVVANKDALTPEDIKAIKAKVQAVNPGATVVVDDKGNATVVTPDGQTATIPVTDLVKSPEEAKDAKAGNNVNKPADKVAVDKDNLQPADKEKIKEAILKVNPDAKVFVDDKGNATVTTKDGKTATIPVEDLVKDPAAKETPNAGNKVNTPATKVVVTSPDNKEDDEAKIKAEILKVNPGATVVFDTEGNATVTTKDGAVATIPAADLAKDAADLTKPEKQDEVNKPADKTVVKKAGKLTQAEKDAIKAEIAKVNRDPQTTIVVDDEGNATVTTPAGKTVVIAKEDLVKSPQEVDGAKAGNNINKPADKVAAVAADLVGPKKDEVAAKIKKAVEAVNPGATVFVDEKGNATVTTPEGNTATIPVEDLLKDPAAKETPSAGNKVNTPAERTVVANPAELTDAEKAKITAAIQAVNPEGTKVVFDEAGNATVTVPNEDGTTSSTATIPVSDLVKSNAEKDLLNPAKQNPIKKPIDQTVVADKNALTKADLDAIKAKVQEVNPDATVVVDEKGNATVTTKDGKTAVIAADDLVKTNDEVLSDAKAGNLINKPADRVFVKDGQITDDVKAKIAAKVQRINPGATVFVDDKGNATVTTPEGKTATIPVADLTKTDADKDKVNAGNKINSPADRVLVKDRDKLTAEDIQEIEKNILEVNPGATVVFDAKGNATVKNANGDIATIPVEALAKPKADLLKPEKQDLIKKPVDKVLVTDPANVDKDAIKKAVEEVNPGATVVVDDKGNATVTTEDGRSFVIPAKDLVKTAEEAKNAKAGNNINKPADKVVVADPTKPLSQEEKKAIEAKIKEVNPDAKAIFVDDKGNATVTIEDKDGNTETATIPAADLVTTQEEAKQPNAGNKVNTPADKVVVSDPDHLSDEEKSKITEAIKAVNPEANVVFDDKGNATVTTKDGEVATIPAVDLVKTKEEAAKSEAGNNVNTPADKVAVDSSKPLTKEEQDAIAAKVAEVNPGATVAVDDKGNATVTTTDGKTAVIPAASLVKTAEEAAKPNAGNDVVKPADKTVVANPESLTKEEQDAIAAKVAEVNPEAKTVIVDDKGNATVTTKDGKAVVIPAKDLVKTAEEAAKPNAGNDVNTPADKTVVANPNALTPEEKKAIEDKVKAVNPGAEVVVDNKGNATVTKDGKVAVIPAKDLTKTADSAKEPNAGNDVVKPADKTVVANPESLTQEEKDAIVAKVKAVNPDATVVVDEKGNATVTHKDGKPVVVPASDLTKSPEDATKPNAGNDIVKPADKTVVANKDTLTPEEKKAIEDKVKAVNPGAEVVVDDKGNATVTKDGKVAVIPAADLTKTAADAAKPNAGNDVNTPADKTVVANPNALTPEEKKAIEDKVKAVNPGSTVVVDDKGNATVTTPEGKTAVIPAADLTKSKEDAAKPNAGNDVAKPADKTVVKDPAKLTDEEKQAITDKLTALNPDAKVVVDDKGNATVTPKDGKPVVIPAADLTKTEAQAKEPNAGNDVSTPADKTVVANPDSLTQDEKDAIAAKVKAVNPGAEVVVDDKGNATVTLPNGKTAVIPAIDLTKSAAQAKEPNAGNDVAKPADKTVVANKDALTPEEKKAIEDKVKAVNPGAEVVVDDKGNATVTLPNGKTAVIPATDLTKSAADAAKPNAGNDIVKPADKTVVTNPDSLTQDEKDAIAAKVKAVNPGAEVVVDDKGNATVTKDGKTAVIPAADLTKTAEDAAKPKAGNDIVKPASKTKVANPDSLTPEEKKAIADKVAAVNPGATVVVDDKGNATVTLPNGNTAVIPASDLTKSVKDVNDGKAKDNAVTPAAKTKVANPEKLTDAEKKAIEDKVKALNPGATVVVDDKGNATVVKDGNVSVIPSTDLVKVEDDAKKENGGNGANTPAAKTVVADSANLTDEEKGKVKKAVEAVNPEATVVVDNEGNATVTKADGTVLNIPASDLVIPATKLADEAKNAKVKTPATRTLVGDKDKLTDEEKAAVKKAIEAVNPGATVVVDDKGNATVTSPDGSTATISKDKLVKNAEEAKAKNGGDNLDIDLSKVPVVNINNITPEEKAKFQFKVLGAITDVEEFDLDAYIKSIDKDGNTVYTFKKDPKVKITIDKDGNATIEKDGKKEAAVSIDKAGNVTIVTKEGQVLAIPRDDAFRQKPTLPGKVGVGNVDKLTDEEKAAVKEALIKANPKLADANITIADNGDATIVYPDGQVVEIPGANLVTAKASDNGSNGSNGNTGADTNAADSNAQGVNAKLGQRLANTGTTETNTGLAGLGLAVLGGLLAAARRRKEK
ncbi:DUF1542 domain-containing protein [Gemella sp.]